MYYATVKKGAAAEAKAETPRTKKSEILTLWVGSHDISDPVQELTHLDVDPGVAWKATALTP